MDIEHDTDENGDHIGIYMLTNYYYHVLFLFVLVSAI